MPTRAKMETGTTTQPHPSSPQIRAGIARRALQILIMVAVQALLLFLSAGTPGWLEAWAFLALYLIGIAVNSVLMMRFNPEMVAERAKAVGMRRWDKLIGVIFVLSYMVGVMVVAGLHERYAWDGQFELSFKIAGAALYMLGFALIIWSMVSNAFFVTTVRIQKERDHAVCDRGPYHTIRHPGYAGAILQCLGVPLLLASSWALLPGIVAALSMVARTALEDRTLRQELPGYAAYTLHTRSRLLPGVW